MKKSDTEIMKEVMKKENSRELLKYACLDFRDLTKIKIPYHSLGNPVSISSEVFRKHINKNNEFPKHTKHEGKIKRIFRTWIDTIKIKIFRFLKKFFPNLKTPEQKAKLDRLKKRRKELIAQKNRLIDFMLNDSTTVQEVEDTEDQIYAININLKSLNFEIENFGIREKKKGGDK